MNPETTVKRASVALDECAARAALVASRIPTDDSDWAVRCGALALIHAREAAWWHVLYHACVPEGLPSVFRRGRGRGQGP